MSSLTGAVWDIRRRAPKELFARLGDIPPLAVQLLHNRGYGDEAEIREFLDGPLPPHDPYLLDGMDAAVARVEQAVAQGERVYVYGDYDVDGVTGTALLLETFEMLGAAVTPYIPERLTEGYGLNHDAVDAIGAQGPGLMVTVDCGIGGADEIARARSHGIDTIVTDHHMGDGADNGAVAVLNPNQPGGAYPFPGLSGVGVAYKLVQALAEEMPEQLPYPEEFLDLVALGTVADMAPLRDENRTFVAEGLEALRQTRRRGLHALGEIARRPVSRVGAADIAFGYAPRLNAAGRLARADLALRLLRAGQSVEAESLAHELDNLNIERRRLTQLVIDAAAAQIDPAAPLVFAIGDEFPLGVVGLAAGRLAEQTGLPAFVGAHVNGVVRGSARAPEGVMLADVLGAQADLLDAWGGHAQAAGFTVRPERVDALRDGLARELELAGVQAPDQPRLEADCRVYPRTVTWETCELTQQLGPFGEAHAEPRFVVENVAIDETRVVGSTHLVLRFAELGADVEAIWFGQAELRHALPPGRRCDAAFRLNLRTFNDETRLQMLIDDIRHTAET